ncbi:hypothetical protein JNB11_08550 [Kocuria palustris]|nr:hypothetical protein [Kocuria palustris]
MSRHQFDLIQCLKLPLPTVGLVCGNCDGRCPSCDSLVKPTAPALVCRECSTGHMAHKCIVCGNYLGEANELGIESFYCFECVQIERHREGCPRVVNVGTLKTDMKLTKAKQLQR